MFDLGDGLDEAELVSVALTLNPELRAKRLQIGETQALLVQAGLWPNPELAASVRPSLDGASSLAVGIDLLFGLLRPGERGAKQAIASARIDAARNEVISAEFRIAASARRTRLAVLAAERTVALLEQEASLRDEAVAFVRRRLDLGEANQMDLALVELERVSVQRDLREARAETESSRRTLNQILGLPPSLPVPLTTPGQGLSFTVFEDPNDDELDQRLLAGRFELRSKEAEYRAAEEELRLAVLRQYPSLKIGPSYERDLEGGRSLGLGAVLELPLFDRNQGEIAAKDAQRERIRADYAALLHGLRAQAFEARAALRRAHAEIDLQQREVVPLLARTESLFESAFRAKEINVVDWLTARGRAVQTKREHLRALVRYASALTELETALGMPLTGPTPQSRAQQQDKK